MKKFKLIFKKTFCIFFSVVILFFSVNNSYFSPHKMDNVNAEVITATFGIGAKVILGLLGAVAVTGLSCAVIDEWSDMDIEAVADDLHDWCRDNYDSISAAMGNAVPAPVRQWVQSDEWVIVVDFGEGGGDFKPSPQPSKEPVQESEPQHLTEPSINDRHGLKNLFRIGAGVGAGGLGLSSILAPFYALNEYGQYVDENGEVIPEDDARLQTINIPSYAAEIAKSYLQDKINNFDNEELTDPISEALRSRFEENPVTGWTGKYPAAVDGRFPVTIQYNCRYFTNIYHSEYAIEKNLVTAFVKEGSKPFAYIYGTDSHGIKYCIFNGNETIVLNQGGTKEIYYSDTNQLRTTQALKGAFIITEGYMHPLSINVPIFSSVEAGKAYAQTGDDSLALNRGNRTHNYIDSSDDYGWASTAQLSPADLFQTVPDLAGQDFSMVGLGTAINALKAKLEEENPNNALPLPATDPASAPAAPVAPVPYPTVEDYKRAVEDVLPKLNPQPATEPAVDPVPDSAPSTDTMKDYSGFLGSIINILRSILDLLRQLVSWFVIDFDAIKAHILLLLSTIPAFDGFNEFLTMINNFRHFVNDKYEYPKLTIQTPDILKPYYKMPEIVLVDFKDYAKYFLLVRAVMSYTIAFGFVMWVVKNVRISFTLN